MAQMPVYIKMSLEILFQLKLSTLTFRHCSLLVPGLLVQYAKETLLDVKTHYSKYNFSLESREFWWINRTLTVRILAIIFALLGQIVIEKKITYLHSLSATLDVYKIQSSHPWKQMQSSKEAHINYLPFYKFNKWNIYKY